MRVWPQSNRAQQGRALALGFKGPEGGEGHGAKQGLIVLRAYGRESAIRRHRV